MPITLKDIASEAGLSPMTISEVLRGVGRASEMTRQRVLRLANQMGYRPHAGARATRSGRQGAIGILSATHSGRSVPPNLLTDGVFDGVAQRDLLLTLMRLTDALLTDEQYVPGILRKWCCDGLLINYQVSIPEKLTDLIAAHHIPSIWVNTKMPADCIFADDLQAAGDATRWFIANGHKRIGYADYEHGRQTPAHYSGFDRREGYRRAMEEAGLEPIWLNDVDALPASPYVPPKDFFGGRRMHYSLQWMSQKDRPTAVLTYGHETAIPMMMAAERLQIRTGKDLMIITMGDRELWITSIGCSTMVMQGYDMGRQAVDMLLQKIANPSEKLEPRKVNYRFYRAHSTGHANFGYEDEASPVVI